MSDVETIIARINDLLSAFNLGHTAAMNADDDTLSNINTAAQEAATAAGMATSLGSLLPCAVVPSAAASVSTGEFAAGIGFVVLLRSIEKAKTNGWDSADVASCTSALTMCIGDLTIVVGGLSSLYSTPQGRALGFFSSLGGATLTGISIGSDEYEQSTRNRIDLLELSSSLQQYSGSNSAVQTLLNTIQPVKSLLDSLNGNATADTLNTLSSTALNSLQTGANTLATEFQNAFQKDPSIIEISDGNTVSITSSDTSMPAITGTTMFDVTSDTTSMNVLANDGSVNSTMTESFDASGAMTTTTNNVMPDGTQNTTSITTTPDGRTSAAVSGQGAEVALGNADITVADGTSGRVLGNDNSVTVGNNCTVTVDGSGDTINAATTGWSGAQVALGEGGSYNLTMEGSTLTLAGGAQVTMADSGDLDVVTATGSYTYNWSTHAITLPSGDTAAFGTLSDGSTVSLDLFSSFAVIDKNGFISTVATTQTGVNGLTEVDLAGTNTGILLRGDNSQVGTATLGNGYSLATFFDESDSVLRVQTTDGWATLNIPATSQLLGTLSDGTVSLGIGGGTLTINTDTGAANFIVPDQGVDQFTFAAGQLTGMSLSADGSTLAFNLAPGASGEARSLDYALQANTVTTNIGETHETYNNVSGPIDWTSNELKLSTNDGDGVFSEYVIGVNGQVAQQDLSFGGTTWDIGSVDYETPTGPITNTYLTDVSVVDLGDIPLGSSPFATDPTGAVAGGLVISGADVRVVFPTVNDDGVFNNSPSGIVSGYWRPGNDMLSSDSENLYSVLGNALSNMSALSGDIPSYGLALADAATGSSSWLNIDPLVIDLTGNGIQTTSWTHNSVYFDTMVDPATLQADGKLHHTSWVAPGTGILAMDLNGNGKIDDITETFSQYFASSGYNIYGYRLGSFYNNGIEALAALFNGIDGAISPDISLVDPKTGNSFWNEIVVWNDVNGNGVTDPGELEPLVELGITSISLHETEPGTSLDGSKVEYQISYTRNDGTIGQIYDIDLSSNPVGDTTTAIDDGVVIQSTTGTGTSVSASFIAKSGTARNYLLSHGQLTDTTTGSAVIAQGAAAVFSTDQNDTITVAADDTTSYWLGGGSGADTLTGGAGNDIFLINSKTVVHGGTGFNIAEVDDGNPITVDLQADNLQEVIGGTGDGVFNASGTTWNVFIQGGSGNNIMIGGAASAALSGGTGNDLIELGSGGGVVHAGSGTDIIYGGSGTTGGAPNSDVIYAGAGNDIVKLGSDNAIVYAGSGTLTVIGKAGAFSVLGLHGSYADYTLHQNADGSITVTNLNNMDGDGVVTIKNVTALDFKDIAQINITTTRGMPANDRLSIGNASQVTVDASGEYVVAAATLLANDIDYAGKTLSIRELLDNNGNAIARGASGQVSGGMATLSADGATITFAPTAGFTGVMSFRYHIEDSDGQNGLMVNEIGTTDTAELAATVYLNTPSQPTDPLFDSEWYLQAADVLPLLGEVTGAGVSVGVFDVTGNVDFSNADLAVNAGKSVRVDGTLGVEQIGTHATLVAGVIGAAIDGKGAVGVAPGATISSEAVGLTGSSSQDFENLMDWSNYDVTCNSFGVNPPFNNLYLDAEEQREDERELTELTTLQNAIYGRDGKGTIVVVAGGNNRSTGQNTNDFILTNSPEEITVGGVNAQIDLGTLHISGAPFSDAGYSILVSAPANDITSDGVSYTNDFGQQFGASIETAQGTSFAAPIVAGVVADILQVNPNLTWQDVQAILAYSAVKVDSADVNPFVRGATAGTGWAFNGATNWNGGGLHYSPDYGFGEVDAAAAVRLAASWQSLGAKTTKYYTPYKASGQLSSGTLSCTFVEPNIGSFSLEHVQVAVNISNAIRSNLTITLTSPSGVTSTLMARPGSVMGQAADAKQYGTGEANDFTASNFTYTFETVADWGETISGNWTVNITDASGSVSKATVTGVTLSFGGVTALLSLSSQGQVSIYTDEFAQLSSTVGSVLYDANNAARAVLHGSGYSDAIDLAATSGSIVLDMQAGSTDSTIDGRSLTIATGSKIDEVMLGAGAATVHGNNDGDTFYAGAGNDIIYGGGGDNTYIMGTGQATIINGASSNPAPSGTLSAGTTSVQDLWFSRSGDDLVVRVLGETGTTTIQGWFANSASQLREIKGNDGLAIEGDAIPGLVNAMTAYQSSHPGFDPTTATAPPADLDLRAWYAPLDYVGSGTNFDWFTQSNWTHTFTSTESAIVFGNNDTISLLPNSSSILMIKGTGKINSIGNIIDLLEQDLDDKITINGSNNNIKMHINNNYSLRVYNFCGETRVTDFVQDDKRSAEFNCDPNNSVEIRGDNNNITIELGEDIIVNGNYNSIIFEDNNKVMTTGIGEIYNWGQNGSQSEIGTASGAPTGEVVFDYALTNQNLWFQQVGNNLQIDHMGNTDHLTIDNWFGGGNAAAVQSFTTGNGLKLESSQVSQLVQAMATYMAANPNFDPTAHANTSILDQTVLAVVNASWHY